MATATFNEPFAVSPYRGPYGGMHDGDPGLSQKPENGSWPPTDDLNADLRLTKCIVGL